MAGKRVVGHGQFHRFQPLDFVAQAGGLLELEVLGGFAHLGAQPVEMGRQIGPYHRLVDLGGHARHIGVALVEAGQNILDILFHRGRCNPMRLVMGDLLGASAVGFAQSPLHRAGDAVGIHDHAPLGVARGAPDGLDQRGFRAQKAFLIGVQDRHQPAFGNIQPLAQQVDADQHVKGPKPQIAQDLDPFDRVDVGMHVAHADALFMQVFGQILGHALGQGGDQHAHVARGHPADFVEQVIDLHLHRPDLDHRVQQAGGADHLFGENTARLLQFPCRWGGGNKDGLRAHRIPFLEFQRAVIHAGRQAKAMLG